MKKAIALCSILPVFLSLSCVGIGKSISANGIINVPYSTSIPNIDGKWSTPNEWTDASETLVQNANGWTAYFRIKTNQTHIFILLDFPTDQSNNVFDCGGICIDTDDNGGNIPKVDDYLFEITRDVDVTHAGYISTSILQGTGKGGTGYFDAYTFVSVPNSPSWMSSSFSYLNDPYEGGKNHQVYEFQIPVSYIGEGYSYGFYAFVFDRSTHTYLDYPIVGISDTDFEITPHMVVPAPGNWGNIRSSIMFVNEITPTPSPTAIPTPTPTPSPSPGITPSPSIPELPPFIAVPILIVSILAVAIIYKKRIQKINN